MQNKKWKINDTDNGGTFYVQAHELNDMIRFGRIYISNDGLYFSSALGLLQASWVRVVRGDEIQIECMREIVVQAKKAGL
jgi:hypothetical protein